METHIVTINEVKKLLEAQELKLTSEMNKEINLRVNEEVDRQINKKLIELKKEFGL